MKIKKIVSLFCVLGLLLGVAACSEKPVSKEESGLQKISFVLEWEPNTNHTGVYAAKAKGYYEEVGLDVEILAPPENGAASLVASGKAQFGVEVQESLANALTLESPMPITAVASIIDHNTSGLLSLKEKGIDSFEKLEGKIYASWEAPTELAILKQTMEDAGGDFEKLLTVPAPATDAISLLKSGDVDAVWVYEAWDVCAAKLAGLDYNYIRFREQSPVLDFYTPFIIANNDFLKGQPEAAKRFLAATAKGYEFAIQNPEEAAQILVDAVPEFELDFIVSSQEFLAQQYKAEKPAWGTFDEARWTAFYDWMFDNKLIPRPLGSEGFTNEFLPQE